MTTTFEDSKVGDKVWCINSGWGEIRARYGSVTYPIGVYFSNGEYKTYTVGGLYTEYDKTQSLFWDEVKFEAPKKPIPDLKVDTKVVVWNYGSSNKYCRHFSHFKNNNIYVFDKGLSSLTGTSKSTWDNWELAE